MDIDIEELAAAVLDQFDRLVRKLLPMIDVGASPLTGNRYKGFATAGMWMAKMQIPSTKPTATEGRKDE